MTSIKGIQYPSTVGLSFSATNKRKQSTPVVDVEIQRLPHAPEGPLPKYQTAGAVGMDLPAAIKNPIVLRPEDRYIFPTGYKVKVPEGYEIQLRARSGLSFNYGILPTAAINTIDWDHKGELKVAAVNAGRVPYMIKPGERIAQMVIAPVTRARWKEVKEIKDFPSDRKGGFGSTGQI